MSTRRSVVPAGLDALVGNDVELRCAGGQVYRGNLLAVGAEFVTLERSTTRRAVIVARAHLAAIVDETPPLDRPDARSED
jgi:hypothetical protein